MQRISKRLEALERAADKEVFADAFPFDVAIAYYLGGARDQSDVAHGYARALGYKDSDELVRASAYLFSQRLERKGDRAAHEARIQRARCELLEKFGYDPRRITPAALPDAWYRIVMTPSGEMACHDQIRAKKRLGDGGEVEPISQSIFGGSGAVRRVRGTKRRQGNRRQ